MIYEIAHKNDFSPDTSLVITVPSEELDFKALYTILADKPNFILPFHYRNVGGQLEFIYQLGSHSKFQSVCGVYSVKKYVELWHSLLDPLIDCGDWFLTPYSFLLHPEYVYWDNEKEQVGYLYIASLRKCSDYEALKEMIIAFSNRATVDDPVVEVMVLRALMNGFNPKDFLRMLDSYIKSNEPPLISRQTPQPQITPPPEYIDTKITTKHSTFVPPSPSQNDPQPVLGDDIIIKLPAETTSAKKQKKTLRDMGIPANKKEKQKKKPKNPDSFLSRLRGSGSEIIIDK